MSNIEFRAVIKYLVKKGKGSTDIYKELVEVYKDTAPSFTTVKKWTALFKRGRESLEDDPREGAPTTSVLDENVCAVEKLVRADRRITREQIAKEVGISLGSVSTILHDKLNMNKVCTRWVPRILTTIQCADRKATAEELLENFKADRGGFLDRIVTGDESWVHHYDPESKAESKEWRRPDSPRPTQPLQQASASKIMMTVFWDAGGILLIDFLPHKQTITATYYADLIRKLRASVKEKRRGKLSRGVLMLHDNAPVHKAHLVQAAIQECGFQEISHPPYSPDLAPSNFYLFANLKKHLQGRKFSDDEEVKSAVEEWFNEKDKTFYEAGLNMLPSRWERVIEHDGQYIEA